MYGMRHLFVQMAMQVVLSLRKTLPTGPSTPLNLRLAVSAKECKSVRYRKDYGVIAWHSAQERLDDAI